MKMRALQMNSHRKTSTQYDATRRSVLGVTMMLCLLGCATSNPVTTEPVNGCDLATAVRYSPGSEVEIRFGGENLYEYVPKCVVVEAGSQVRFRGNLLNHPLAPGRFAAGKYEAESNNPVKRQRSGDEVSFVFPERGAFGFICDTHVVSGMKGAVFVE